MYRTVDFEFSLYSKRILKSIRRTQLSFPLRRTYYYYYYYYCIHTRIYIYRIFSGETCAHQCLFFIRPRKFAITFTVYILSYTTALHARDSFHAIFLCFFTIALIEKCLHIIITVYVCYNTYFQKYTFIYSIQYT